MLSVAAPFVAGCYSYAQVPVERAPVGENVRLVVDRAGVPDLDGVDEGTSVAPTLRGRVTGSENGSLLVRVPLRTDARGAGSSVLDVEQSLRIPMDQVLSLEVQSFSPARTGLLVGGAAAGAAFVIFHIIDGGRGDQDRDPPDPDVLFRLFSIPIG